MLGDQLISESPGKPLVAADVLGPNGFCGPDGPWHDGWVNQPDAARARQTGDQFTAILLRAQRSQDKGLPPQY